MFKRKLLVLINLVIIGNTTNLNAFDGDWTIVKFWPKQSEASKICYSFNIKGTSDVTECKNKDVSLLHMEFERVDYPAIIVDKPEEVTAAVNAECEDYDIHYVVRRLDDNYFVLDIAGNSDDRITALLAKNVPSVTELKQFVQNLEDLKDREGTTICTKEMLEIAKASSSRGRTVVNGLADLIPLKKKTRHQ